MEGKFGSFLIINGHHNQTADFFFRYFTYAGDAILWIPLLIYCVFIRRKYGVAVLAGFIISSILAQFLKRIVFPDELRPITFLSENFPVHVIEGVKMKRAFSFPSGHSATAFTMALLLVYMFNERIWSFIFPLVAFVAGYSRVYLGQHFLTDVLGGIAIGAVSAMIAIYVYEEYLRRRANLKF